MGFQDLNVSKQILMALEEAGFETPTPIQQEVFSVSRSGKDLIGIAQTGTGKTLAYLIPMLMRKGAFPAHWWWFPRGNWSYRCARVSSY